MGAESGMNSSVRDDRVALSDGAKALWGKTNRIDDSEWLPLYVHMVDSAAMASKIWDTWVPQGTKAVIVGDLGNDEVLARKLMIFMAGIHDIGKATPVFQAKSITFGPEAGSFAWKAERAGLPMIAGLRGTNHPTHPIAGEIILEGYLLRVRGWERKAARQYACVVGGHHGTPPDKSKIDEEKNRKTNVGLDSEAWVSTQDELIDFVANIVVSPQKPDFTHIVEQAGWPMHAEWETKNYDALLDRVTKGQQWHFKLRANPARKAGVDKGRRHRSDGIVGKVQGHVTASQQLQWLVDRSVVHGFRILEDEYGQPNVVVKERHKEQFKRGGATVTLVTAVFEGRLEVIDTKLFRDALCEGIGRAKGFGCGLLTIAPETRSNAE